MLGAITIVPSRQRSVFAPPRRRPATSDNATSDNATSDNATSRPPARVGRLSFATLAEFARTTAAGRDNGRAASWGQAIGIGQGIEIDGLPHVVVAQEVGGHSPAIRPATGSVTVIVIVLRVEEEIAADTRSTNGAAHLTPREVQVARLLEQRRTNGEIAAALSISGHTARHHVQRVLDKLGVSSRRQVGRVRQQLMRR